MSVTLAKRLCALLRDKLTDPNSTRFSDGKNWIHWDFPRRTVSEWPRVSVIWRKTDTDPVHLGATRYLHRVHVDVFVIAKHTSMRNKYDSAREGCETIMGDVMETMRDNVSTIKGWGEYSKFMIDGLTPWDDGDLVGEMLSTTTLYYTEG